MPLPRNSQGAGEAHRGHGDVGTPCDHARDTCGTGAWGHIVAIIPSCVVLGCLRGRFLSPKNIFKDFSQYCVCEMPDTELQATALFSFYIFFYFLNPSVPGNVPFSYAADNGFLLPFMEFKYNALNSS